MRRIATTFVFFIAAFTLLIISWFPVGRRILGSGWINLPLGAQLRFTDWQSRRWSQPIGQPGRDGHGMPRLLRRGIILLNYDDEIPGKSFES